jgi:YHS domain-containing protein
MTLLKRFIILAAAVSALTVAISAATGSGERVKQVDAKFVCFINKQRFDKPQTPVVVDGKTYYGCCESCAKTLKEDPRSRVAIDPVSGKEVDKATAVIGADKAGTIYFFESVKHLKRFRVPIT